MQCAFVSRATRVLCVQRRSFSCNIACQISIELRASPAAPCRCTWGWQRLVPAVAGQTDLMQLGFVCESTINRVFCAMSPGALPLQPATAAAAACLLWLGASLVMRALRRSGLLAPLAEQVRPGRVQRAGIKAFCCDGGHRRFWLLCASCGCSKVACMPRDDPGRRQLRKREAKASLASGPQLTSCAKPLELCAPACNVEGEGCDDERNRKPDRAGVLLLFDASSRS